MLWILITGSRWCELLRGPEHALKATAHDCMVRWQEEVAHGYKGKGVATNQIADANGHPIDATATAANIDERKRVHPLLKKLKSWPLQGAILEVDRG